MIKTNLIDDKKRYDLYRHHAWAGSVLLAVLLAVRIFIESLDQQFSDIIFIILGFIIVCYILAALLLTYRYRSGLRQEDTVNLSQKTGQKNQVVSRSKDQLKIEKKKAKNEYKQVKKQQKDNDKN